MTAPALRRLGITSPLVWELRPTRLGITRPSFGNYVPPVWELRPPLVWELRPPLFWELRAPSYGNYVPPIWELRPPRSQILFIQLTVCPCSK